MSPAKWKAIIALAVAGLGAAAAFDTAHSSIYGMLATFLTGGAFVPRPGDIPWGKK